MNEDEFRAWVAAGEWVFAKTMPDMPHWYTLREARQNDEAFNLAVQFVRENGRFGHWYGKPRRYYDLDGFTYWTMGWPIGETVLMNRAEAQ